MPSTIDKKVVGVCAFFVHLRFKKEVQNQLKAGIDEPD
jgi:hypothetical protein